MEAIDEFTEATWGVGQADLYLDEVYGFCELIARTPGMGRFWNEKRPQSKRIEHGSHVIYFTETTFGVLITRVLHGRMLPR